MIKPDEQHEWKAREPDIDPCRDKGNSTRTEAEEDTTMSPVERMLSHTFPAKYARSRGNYIT